MKLYFFILMTFCISFFSCKKENTPSVPLVIDNSGLAGFDSIQTKSFISDVHTTTGTVSIYQKDDVVDTLAYVFRNFKTDNGPNLDVWVSELGIPNANYVNLGDLKSTNGDFIYKTPKVGNITAYPNLLIWCADFDVRFGYAVFDL